MKQSYKIEFAHSGRNDMRQMKKYILDTFKYRELGESFTKKIKEAARRLKTLPTGYDTVGFVYRGYDIYLKRIVHIYFYI